MINNMIRFGCNSCATNPFGCNVCNYFSTYGTSKARWCCGGDPSEEIDQYASLYIPDTLTVPAGGPLPFTSLVLTGAFSYNAQNQLVILQPGIYRAVYTLNIPAGAVVDTTLQLMVGNRMLPGAQISVTHGANDGTVTITGQALFESGYATPLELLSSSALSLVGENPGDVLATLTITTL